VGLVNSTPRHHATHP